MKKRKRLLLGIVISMVLAVTTIAISLSSTQALFARSDTSTRRNNYNTGILSITAISKSDNISLEGALPMTDEQGAAQEPYTFTIRNNGNVDYQFDIQLLSTTANTFDPQYIKLKVDNDAVTTLSALTNSKIKTSLTLAAQQTMDISIRIWLASNTPNSQIGKTFTSELVINGVAVSPTSNYGVTAAAYITNLYNNAAKTIVTNNNIDYNYATSVSLMNDRLGGTTKDLNAGNIRYYGANPNNYIDIGHRNQTAPILYRIIGVFDNMLKVIAVDSIGNYSWDTSDSTVNSGYGINEWSQADLMKLLNPGYENESVNNSLYWNAGSGTCYISQRYNTTSCNFTYTGLHDNVKSKIAEVTWYLGAVNTSKIYSDQAYALERENNVISNPTDNVVRTATWNGKVALLYSSDYGYGADLSKCSGLTLYKYNDATDSYACKNNDWLNSFVPSSNAVFLLSPKTWDQAYVGYINISGNISDSGASAYSPFLVYPVFYLNAEESIKSGTGTSADPYVLR